MDATSRPIARLLIPGLSLIAIACALGWWVLVAGAGPFAVDEEWNSLLVQWRVEALVAVSYGMNWLGGGWFGVFALPIAAALALVLVRRPWAALYFLTASALSAGAVQVLKHLFGRARPEDIIVISDYGSFPSGHTANAATIAVVAFVLFPRLWVAIVGAAWVVLMAFSRTYLHAHWLSDTVGGALVGAGVALVLAAVLAAPLRGEIARRSEIARRAAA